MQLLPIKISIRGDASAGVIRAYIAIADNSQRFEIATLSMQAADDTPGLFEKWTELMHLVAEAFVKKHLGEVEVRFHAMHPDNQNLRN